MNVQRATSVEEEPDQPQQGHPGGLVDHLEGMPFSPSLGLTHRHTA